jgi:beta-glucosidase
MADFVWGAATSAFQIEGARATDGRAPSIWDTFADAGRVPGIDLAGCDHYHRWEEDLDLLAALGVNGYRFSVSWSRVLPDGVGDVNERGMQFYERLVDGLVTRGIRPFLTLYHWDLPQALQDRGGWSARETVDAFAGYADLIGRRLGGRVTDWITHNEPWVATVLGHIEGVFAPGMTDWETGLRVAHHILVSHGAATDAIRERSPGAQVGIAIDCRPVSPASDSPEDISATRHFDGFRNRWFFDPVFGRGYPEDMVEAYARAGRIPDGLESFVEPGDMDLIATPIDFLGLNYYTTLSGAAGHEESEESDSESGPEAAPGHTEMGWRIDAGGLTDYLVHLADAYRPASIVVTENGASYSDGPDSDGQVNDDRRIDYLRLHVEAVLEAKKRGVPVDGYFVWSLLDNLEWTHGYDQRFGLVWVDHHTSQRIPKKSFQWYAELIGSMSDVERPDLPRLVVDDDDPSPSPVEEWMDGYIAAWSSNDPDEIAGLFTSDAVYDPQTADGELHGHEEIIGWWRGIGDTPDNWEFEWWPIVDTDEVAVIAATTRYFDPPASYRNLFVIRFDEDGRCRDFTEWYIEEDAGEE